MKLVASDLDGTLVRRDRNVSPRTIATFQRLHAAGVIVVLVTGRPIRWIAPVHSQLGIPALAICANGAATYDPATDTIVHSSPLEASVLAEACTRLRAEVPEVVFAVERDGGRQMRHEPGFPVGPWEADHDSVAPLPLADIVTRPAAKLLVRAGVQSPDEFTARVGACLTGLAEATNSSSSGMVEVSAAGVTKASALALVARSHSVTAADVVAFGDMPNDLPMLTWAGRGVAMANAHPAVRAAASDVTKHTNEDDGVAEYLERLYGL
ncbi:MULTISPECIES: HAD family hydrolase [Dactylosporangium]|uniref:Haloacid dehalogenase n=2 Tax=Dactylosporangium TaxID=35753 RepID=A0A9W6KKB0_9ACTN|nr:MULTISPECIES: HAD family hydrolase [Dactylosporangium]UAB96554.1 HAD family phosphatase [Dactylosporangium vinaceum]UWZ44877.1 HAD family phosphatase [Dactylosporangium matsuzakiense]GLL03647.1 haloacid dehalogenase [Dactylosporangium matsuzakiense]